MSPELSDWFDPDWDADVITDFEVGVDTIGFYNVIGLDSFDQLALETWYESSPDGQFIAVTTLAFGDDSIQLRGVSPGELSPDNFLFLVF